MAPPSSDSQQQPITSTTTDPANAQSTPLDATATISSTTAPSSTPPPTSPAARPPPPRVPVLPSTNAPPAHVVDALLSCDTICFDVDSTVITEEGIDVLAAHLGLGPQVAALTASAMNGALPFHVALTQRLSLLRPSLSSIHSTLASHPLQLTPGFLPLLTTLRRHGKRIFLITGGFIQMLHPHLLAQLDIPVEDCYSNVLLFDPQGEYLAFDLTQPTSMSGGKARAVGMILGGGEEVQKVVMVGDGMTDVEARPPAVAMVGYGGVVVREPVRAAADWFITDWKELMAVFHAAEAGAVVWYDAQQEKKEGKGRGGGRGAAGEGEAAQVKEEKKKKRSEKAKGKKRPAKEVEVKDKGEGEGEGQLEGEEQRVADEAKDAQSKVERKERKEEKEKRRKSTKKPKVVTAVAVEERKAPQAAPPQPPPPPPPPTPEERRAQAERAKAAVEAALDFLIPSSSSSSLLKIATTQQHAAAAANLDPALDPSKPTSSIEG